MKNLLRNLIIFTFVLLSNGATARALAAREHASSTLFSCVEDTSLSEGSIIGLPFAQAFELAVSDLGDVIRITSISPTAQLDGPAQHNIPNIERVRSSEYPNDRLHRLDDLRPSLQTHDIRESVIANIGTKRTFAHYRARNQLNREQILTLAKHTSIDPDQNSFAGRVFEVYVDSGIYFASTLPETMLQESKAKNWKVFFDITYNDSSDLQVFNCGNPVRIKSRRITSRK